LDQLIGDEIFSSMKIVADFVWTVFAYRAGVNVQLRETSGFIKYIA